MPFIKSTICSMTAIRLLIQFRPFLRFTSLTCLVVTVIMLMSLYADAATIPIDIFVDDGIRNAEVIMSAAKQQIEQVVTDISFENIIHSSPVCNERPTDSEQVFKFYQDFLLNNHRIVIGPTCEKNFYRFTNLTYEMRPLIVNVFAESGNAHKSMVELVTRSARNLASNIIAVLNGFDWSQIGIVLCEECYKDDPAAAENHMDTVVEYIREADISVARYVTVYKGVSEEVIKDHMNDFHASTNVVFMFLGNHISDYIDYIRTLRQNNYTDETFNSVITLTKYATDRDFLWTNDNSQLPLFDKILVLYNNCYEMAKNAGFFTKYSFQSIDEMIISYHLYESLYLLASYAPNAQLNQSVFNYENVKTTLSTINIQGPYSRIFINRYGERIEGYTLILIDSAHPETGNNVLLPPITVDTSCYDKACLSFVMNRSLYEYSTDEPFCGFQNTTCGQEGVLYALISIILIGAAIILLVYMMKKMYQQKRRGGRNLNTPWLIPFNEIKIIDLNAIDGSQHMSIQSLQRKLEEKQRLESITVRTKHIASIDNRYCIIDKYYMKDKIRFDRNDSHKLYQLKTSFQHDNINSFMGFSFDKQSHIYIIWGQCFRGNLADLVLSERKTELKFLNDNIQGSFVRDILKGLDFLHSSVIGFHGALTSQNCMIDAHWILKLTGYGVNNLLYKWKTGMNILTLDNRPIIPSSELHYYAPEIRRHLKSLMSGTKLDQVMITPDVGKYADMYSFGMVLFDILFHKKVVDIEDASLPDCELISERADSLIPLYPDVPEAADRHPDLISLLHRCWNGNARERPDPSLARKITDSTLKLPGTLADQMIRNMEDYTGSLEKQVEERTADLQVAQQKADDLLTELLPKSIAADLKMGKTINAQTYESATILYSDIVGFTSLCSESKPMEVVVLLSGMYQRFDLIISQQNGYKMETIGDAYCVAAGLPIASETEHVKSIAMIALLQRDFLHQFEIPHRKGQFLNCRWGFNTGPVFSGVIGIRAPRYSCFGATVTIAAKMESSGVPDRIQMTLKSQQLISEYYPEFGYSSRGTCKIDGIGTFLTYWLDGFKEEKTSAGRIKAYRSHINQELEKISKKKKDHSSELRQTNSMSNVIDATKKDKEEKAMGRRATVESLPEENTTDEQRVQARIEAEKLMKHIEESALNSSALDTPPSSSASSSEVFISSPLVRADSTLSTIPETDNDKPRNLEGN